MKLIYIMLGAYIMFLTFALIIPHKKISKDLKKLLTNKSL